MRIDELPIHESIKKIFLEEGICELYPPQEDAFKKTKVLDGGNLLMASPTASGKTLVAEVCALKHILELNGKVLYTTPLKALASEKYERFKRCEKLEKSNGDKVRVTVSTGDYDSSDPWLGKYDLIVTTYEKFDSLLRHGATWVKELSLLVVDEVHYLGQGDRGPTLEVVLTRFRRLNYKGQILALSATVRNVEEIAEWLNAEYITTDWRPVKLREGVYVDGRVMFNDGTVMEIEEHGNPIESITHDTIRNGGQILIFTDTRRNAVTLAKRLTKTVKPLLNKQVERSLKRVANSILSDEALTSLDESLASFIENGVAFHHAGLKHDRRTVIEDAFRKGYIKALTATPTLAAGVNLPARRVTLISYERYEPGYGRSPISVMEYKQMCLPYDAKILLADGTYAKIGEIVDRGGEVKLTTLDEKSHKLRSNRLLEKFSQYAKEFVELEVLYGEKIKVTPEHPILTSNGWKEARNITTGDKIAHITRIPYTPKIPEPRDILPSSSYVVDVEGLFGKWIRKATDERGVKKKELARMLNVNYKTFLSWTYPSKRNVIPLNVFIRMATLADYSNVADHIKVVKTAYGKPLNLENLLTGDLFWFAGLVAADGNLNQRRGTISIRVFNKDERIIHKACKVLEKLGLKYRLSRMGRIWAVECSSILLGFILMIFGIPIGKKSDKLYISDIVKNLPKPLLAQYLAGVFDGGGNYTESRARSTVRLIRIHSKSRRFAEDLREVLLRLGIVSYVHSKPIDFVKDIRGKKAHFKGIGCNVFIRSIIDINSFFDQTQPIKKGPYNPNTVYRIRSGEISRRNSQVTWSRVIRKKIIVHSEPIPVYNVAVAEDNNYICNNLVLHNCGRAGRPNYDPIGESILIARNDEEADFIMEHYIYARPERIWSNLGAEPYLRSHVLSVIATDMAHDKRKVLEFFSKTLYVHQMGVEPIVKPIGEIIRHLEENGFIKTIREKIEVTSLGRRVSELYIDPLSAAIMVDGFENRKPDEMTDFALLQLIAHTPDAKPKLYPRRGEAERLTTALELHKDELLIDLVDAYLDAIEFEALLGEVKMALVLYDWMNEQPENAILEKYDVEPGDLYRIISSAEWLLYAAQELSKLMTLENLSSKIRVLRERVKFGVKEELLPLIFLEGVGRVRARALYNAGYRAIEDLKRASIEELMRIPTIGGKISRKIKEQVGGLVSEKSLKAAEEAGSQKMLTDYSQH